MTDPLAPLVADGVVEEICARLKSGKEADLWLVRHGGALVAAKVYKAREARSFRNNAGYKEGRQVRDTRTQRAMDRGSRFGQAAAEEAWKAKEADALHALHAAGVRVPRPVMFYEGVLLMELVVDAHGHPAPRLVDARIAREEAAPLYADLRAQAVRMLGCDLIHGDLSPYNVLLGRDGPVVIDFPQVVGAAHNSQAESFFRRDLENLRRFFAAVDPALRSAEGDAHEIWRAYVRRELTPDFVPKQRSVAAAPKTGQGHAHGHGEGQARGERHRGRSRPPPGDAGRRDAGGRERDRRDAGGPERDRRDPGRRDPGREPGRREPERRRGGATPEVIRVSRPPLGGAAPQPGHAAHPARPPQAGQPPQHGARRPDAHRHRQRRR